MKIILLVHVCQSLQRLEKDVANHVLRKQLPTIFHNFKHVLIEVFENEMQCLILQNDLLQIHDVWVREFYQWLHLLLVNARIPLVITFLHLLNSDDLASLFIHGLDHGPVRAVTDHLYSFVLIHFLSGIEIISIIINNYTNGFWNYILYSS